MKTSELQNILKRMENTINGEPWFGRPVMDLLNEVNHELAFQKQEFAPYSIADLVAHMIYWKRYVRDAMIGNDGERDQEKSFSWRHYGEPGKTTWSLMLTDFHQLYQSVTECLKNLSIDLQATVPGRDFNYERLLTGAIDHDIYHIGQVILSNKINNALPFEGKANKHFTSLLGIWGAGVMNWLVMIK